MHNRADDITQRHQLLTALALSMGTENTLVLAGIASAFVFIAGGVLAARLGSPHARRAGFLIGLYYGGTGFGIAASALLVPAAIHAAAAHGAPQAWQWLGLCF